MSAEDLHTALERARRLLETRTRRMLGLDAQLIPALGSVFARGGDSAEVVTRELGQLSARMALDPSAFYDAAALRSESVKAQVVRLLEGLSALTDGRNAILSWSAKTGLPDAGVRSLKELLDTLRRARFARTEVQQIVRTDLVDAARAAADEISERMNTASSVELPTASLLDDLVVQSLKVEDGFSWVQGTRSEFSAVDFATSAIIRVLEASDIDLGILENRTNTPEGADVEGDAAALALSTGVRVILEALLSTPDTFGDLLVLEAHLVPEQVNAVAQVLLQPIPRALRGGKVFGSVIEEAPSVTADDGTVQERRYLRTYGTYDRAEETWFVQDVEIAHDEDLVFAGLLAGREVPKATGTGTFLGEPLESMLVDQDPGTGQIDAWASVGALPASVLLGELAYVVSGATHDLYTSNGNGTGGSTNWSLQDTGVEVLGGRYLMSSDTPFEGADVVPGDAIYLTNIVGTSSPAWINLTISEVGHTESDDEYRDQFGVTISSHVTNSTDWSFDWEIPDPAMITDTPRFYADPTSPVAFWDPTEAVGRSVTVFVDEYGWTHRFVASFTREDDGGVTLGFDFPLPNTTAALYVPRLPGTGWPKSRMVWVRGVEEGASGIGGAITSGSSGSSSSSSSSTTKRDVVDLVPGDILRWTPPGDPMPFDGYATVLHASGGRAVLDRSVHTDVSLRADILAGYDLGYFQASWRSSSVLEAFIPAKRFRHIRVGDVVHVLPQVRSSPPSSTLYTDAGSGGVYKVEELSPDGVVMSVVQEDAGTVLPAAYTRTAVVPAGNDVTDLVHVVDQNTEEPTALFSLDRQVRRLKSDRGQGTLTDVWPSRSLTVFRSGAPVDASRVGNSLLSLGSPVSIREGSYLAEIRVRDSVEGYGSNLSFTRTELQDEYTDATGDPYPRTSLGASTLTDIESRRSVTLVTGFVDGTPPPDTEVQGEYRFDAEYTGPITLGGPKEYALWAWADYLIRTRSVPDYDELRENLGRALTDLGTVKTQIRDGLTVTVDDRDARIVTISGISPALPNSLFLEGMDLDGMQPVDPDVPFRVESAVDPTAASFSSAQVVLSALPDPSLPEPYTGVAMYNTSVAQAWREVRGLVKYLDDMYSYLDAVRAPEFRPVAAAAERLHAAGFSSAARAVEKTEFSKWTDPVQMSDNSRVVDAVNSLVDSMLTRRRSVFD